MIYNIPADGGAATSAAGGEWWESKREPLRTYSLPCAGSNTSSSNTSCHTNPVLYLLQCRSGVAYVSCQKQASKEAKDDLDGQLPLAGPGIHGCHALPSQCIQPADHVSEVEGLVWGGEAQLHQVRVLQVPSTAAQVVHHGHWHAALAWAATARCLCSFIRRGHGSFPALPFTRRSKQSTRLQTRRWQVLTRWNRRVLASCSGEEWQ